MCVTWISQISHAHDPDFCIDEQRFGPYKFSHHRNLSKAVSAGTQVTDIVHYDIGYDKHDAVNVQLYFTESFTFRILESAATIHFIAQ